MYCDVSLQVNVLCQAELSLIWQQPSSTEQLLIDQEVNAHCGKTTRHSLQRMHGCGTLDIQKKYNAHLDLHKAPLFGNNCVGLFAVGWKLQHNNYSKQRQAGLVNEQSTICSLTFMISTNKKTLCKFSTTELPSGAVNPPHANEPLGIAQVQTYSRLLN